MKALRTLRVSGLAVGSLVAMACNIIPLAPSLVLSVQAAAYTVSTIDIPYSYATLSTTSIDGTANCSYRISKWISTDGSYREIDRRDETLPKSGTLSLDLPILLGIPSGSSDVDGTYRLSFAVNTGRTDLQGNPIPVSYLSTTRTFSVHTYPGPEIFTITPTILNINDGPKTILASGLDFTSTSTLSTLSASPLTGSTFVTGEEMRAVVNPTTLSAGSQLSVYVSDAQGRTSPTYFIPIVNNVTISAVAPEGDSRYNSNLPVYITGSFLGFWSKVTIVDQSGNAAGLDVQQSGGSYIFGYVDLSPLAPGPATLTATNPDGSSASYPFTVYN